MGVTKTKRTMDNLKLLAKYQVITTCILMGSSFSRCADVFSIEKSFLVGHVFKLVNLAGWGNSLDELRENKFRVIDDILSVKPRDFTS